MSQERPKWISYPTRCKYQATVWVLGIRALQRHELLLLRYLLCLVCQLCLPSSVLWFPQPLCIPLSSVSPSLSPLSSGECFVSLWTCLTTILPNISFAFHRRLNIRVSFKASKPPPGGLVFIHSWPIVTQSRFISLFYKYATCERCNLTFTSQTN